MGGSQRGMDLKRRDVDRKSALLKNNFGSQLDLDNASTASSPQCPGQLLQQKIATARRNCR
jgi:membrane fusion protein (multidrug efflux system)